MMKILLLSLNSDPLSKNPKTYGGSGRTFRLLAENIENCYIAGKESCFEGDINNKCIPLSDIFFKKNGGFEDYGRLDKYDIVVYANPSIVLNTTKPQLCWAVGAEEVINPDIKNLLVHNLKWQKPAIQNPNTKIHEFVLGVEIPEFQKYEKKDQILQITNHYPHINSITLAQWALKHKIKTIFAGPISDGYPLLDYIDYDTTWYLGQIKEEEKVKLMKESKAHASLFTHSINGPTLSTKSSLSFGTWILTTPYGIMPEIIKNGVNGFVINNENEFLNAWAHRNQPSQFDCWQTSTQWGLDKMVNSFKKVVEEILIA